MCGDPSPEAFGVSENARRPLAGDLRSVGKCAATPRRGFSGCRKVCGEGSADVLHVFRGLFRNAGSDSAHHLIQLDDFHFGEINLL